MLLAGQPRPPEPALRDRGPIPKQRTDVFRFVHDSRLPALSHEAVPNDVVEGARNCRALAGREQARRAEARGVIQAPDGAERLVKTEEVSQAGRTAPTNDLCRNIVTASCDPLGDTPQCRFGIGKPKEHQGHLVPVAASSLQPWAKRPTR